jgi:hypothetical protein
MFALKCRRGYQQDGVCPSEYLSSTLAEPLISQRLVRLDVAVTDEDVLHRQCRGSKAGEGKAPNGIRTRLVFHCAQ